VTVEATEKAHERGAQRASRDRGGRTGDRIYADETNAGRGGAGGEEVGDDLLELRLDVRARDVVVGRRSDGRRVVRTTSKSVQSGNTLLMSAISRARRASKSLSV
jgi:hypothetical protein